MNSLLAICFLLALTLFFVLKEVHEHRLIKKAAQILNIHSDYSHMFRVELLSLYKHQPLLKEVTDYVDFRQLVATNDADLLDRIYEKDYYLWKKKLEYGEAFESLV